MSARAPGGVGRRAGQAFESVDDPLDGRVRSPRITNWTVADGKVDDAAVALGVDVVEHTSPPGDSAEAAGTTGSTARCVLDVNVSRAGVGIPVTSPGGRPAMLRARSRSSACPAAARTG